MFTVPTSQCWGCASPQTKIFEWIDSPSWCSCTVMDQRRVMPAAALGSNGRLWQPNGKFKQSLELRAFPQDNMICLAKVRGLNQLPEVHEITGLGIQPKHLVRNKVWASWGGAKGLAAQLNRHSLGSLWEALTNVFAKSTLNNTQKVYYTFHPKSQAKWVSTPQKCPATRNSTES